MGAYQPGGVHRPEGVIGTAEPLDGFSPPMFGGETRRRRPRTTRSTRSARSRPPSRSMPLAGSADSPAREPGWRMGRVGQDRRRGGRKRKRQQRHVDDGYQRLARTLDLAGRLGCRHCRLRSAGSPTTRKREISGESVTVEIHTGRARKTGQSIPDPQRRRDDVGPDGVRGRCTTSDCIRSWSAP